MTPGFIATVWLAGAFWSGQGQQLECSPVHPVPSTLEQMQALDPDFKPFPYMYADANTCRIYLSPQAQLDRTQNWHTAYCPKMIHEMGHLSGLTHLDADRYPIMNPWGMVIPEVCSRHLLSSRRG